LSFWAIAKNLIRFATERLVRQVLQDSSLSLRMTNWLIFFLY